MILIHFYRAPLIFAKKALMGTPKWRPQNLRKNILGLRVRV